MPRPNRDRPARPRPAAEEAPFRCGHCGQMVAPLAWGGQHRNHCPHCLFSRHVDAARSGDRDSPCGGMMEPIGVFTRRTGEYVLVHRCLTCGFERFNRVAADDNMGLALRLPAVGARIAGPADGGTPAMPDDRPDGA